MVVFPFQPLLLSILSLMWYVCVACIDIFALLIGSMVHVICTVTFATMLQRFCIRLIDILAISCSLQFTSCYKRVLHAGLMYLTQVKEWRDVHVAVAQ